MQGDIWDRIYEGVRERQFEAGATWPLSWKSRAFQLMHAADRLYDLYHDATMQTLTRLSAEVASGRLIDGSRGLEGEELTDRRDGQLILTYFMLAGFALEGLLKGILMATHPEYLKPNGSVVGIKTHDLEELWPVWHPAQIR